MFDKRVMVIRTDDDEKEWIWSELQCGRLRQGWGITDLQLKENGETVPFDVWEKRYSNSSKEIWNSQPKPDEALRRYNILKTMTDLCPEDLVVVPKMPSWDQFTIAKVKERYRFDRERRSKDYGHVIPVETGRLMTVPYYASIDTRLIVKKFRGYQAAVNNAWDSKFIESVVRLFKAESVPIEKTINEIFSEIKKPLLRKFLDQIRGLTYDDLERLVQKAFEEAGYQCVRKHSFDREGGDADLVFHSHLPLISDPSELGLTTFVQVKQKSGEDWDDLKGIDQLTRISAGNPQSVKILISTADEFSTECCEKAQDERVILVSGITTAEILMKYL